MDVLCEFQPSERIFNVVVFTIIKVNYYFALGEINKCELNKN